jgi:hypothetical protein
MLRMRHRMTHRIAADRRLRRKAISFIIRSMMRQGTSMPDSLARRMRLQRKWALRC